MSIGGGIYSPYGFGTIVFEVFAFHPLHLLVLCVLIKMTFHSVRMLTDNKSTSKSDLFSPNIPLFTQKL